MPDDYIPRPNAQFHAWQNNFVTYVNDHLGDVRHAAGAIGAEIWVKIGNPPPTLPPSRLAAQENAKLRRREDTDRVAVPHYSIIQINERDQPVDHYARWVSTSAQTGPWNELVSAAVFE